jgi:hypothetical protein
VELVAEPRKLVTTISHHGSALKPPRRVGMKPTPMAPVDLVAVLVALGGRHVGRRPERYGSGYGARSRTVRQSGYGTSTEPEAEREDGCGPERHAAEPHREEGRRTPRTTTFASSLFLSAQCREYRGYDQVVTPVMPSRLCFARTTQKRCTVRASARQLARRGPWRLHVPPRVVVARDSFAHL